MEPALVREYEELLQNLISGTMSRERYTSAFEIVHRACETDESLDRALRIANSALQNHVRDGVLTRLDRSSDASFLISLRDEWRNFRELMTNMRLLFIHLDSHIEFTNRLKFENKGTMKKLAACVWRDLVLKPLHHKITASFIGIINQDRKGEPVISDEVSETVLDMLASLGGVEDDVTCVYESCRNAYLTDLEEYFWINLPKTQSPQAFLDHTLRFIAEEIHRARRYLRRDDDSVSETIHRLLLASNPNFLSKMVENALIDLDCEKLGELYGMLMPMSEPGLNLLRSALESCFPHHVRRIYERSLEIETDPASVFIRSVMMTERHLWKIVRQAFKDDPTFGPPCIAAVCENAVKQVAELCGESSAELVAKYYDNILNSGKHKNETSLNEELKQALSAAKYVTSAEEFHETYLDLLRERLLKNRWCRVKFEKQAVDALRDALGNEFTRRLPAVLKDVFDSRLVNQVCQGFPPDHETGISFRNFEATTLSREHWIFEASGSDLKLPERIDRTMRFYTTIYRDKLKEASKSSQSNRWTPLRSLTWYHNMAQVDLEANLSHRSCLIKCSAFTAIVLLLFENSDTLSIPYILMETRLSEHDLEATLAQLEELEILTRAAGSTEITLNHHFEQELGVVNLLKPVAKRNIRAHKKNTTTTADRHAYTEALLIRILKKHRQLHYQALLREIREEAPKIKLYVDLDDILKCLKTLEDRDYIEDRGCTYHYKP